MLMSTSVQDCWIFFRVGGGRGELYCFIGFRFWSSFFLYFCLTLQYENFKNYFYGCNLIGDKHYNQLSMSFKQQTPPVLKYVHVYA